MTTNELGESRIKFNDRIHTLPEEVQAYYAQLKEFLLHNNKIKCRQSSRCESFRKGRELLSKIAIGGKTLKLYLALNPNDDKFKDAKYHQRDLTATIAYKQVPFMMPIRSQLAVNKAIRAISEMFDENNL